MLKKKVLKGTMAQHIRNIKAWSQCLQQLQSIQYQPHRTVVVLKRKWPIPLVKKDKPVTTRKLREKHYIYEVVRNEDNIPIPPIKCILTRHVDGIGAGGEIVEVVRQRFWNDLFPSGAALYPTEDNIAEYQDASRLPKYKRTPFALQTYRMLWGMTLPIKLNTSTQWVLNESHVLVALRLAGVHVDDIQSIALPEEPITNSHDEQLPFYVKVKVNDIDEAEVTCYLHPFSLDQNMQAKMPSPPEIEIFSDSKLVNEELNERGMYHGNAELLEQEDKR